MPQYEFINLDAGWSNACDRYGRWIYRTDLFPKGLKALSKYLEQNGQKLGVYILPGIRRDAADANLPIKGHAGHRLGELCRLKKQGNGFPDTTYMPDVHNDLVQAYYDSLADLFADWNISYVKIDGCGPAKSDSLPDTRACLSMMHRAFTRHNIFIELSWSSDIEYSKDWAVFANGTRIFSDIESYSTKTMTSSYRVLQRIAKVSEWSNAAVENEFYIDLDVVLVGMTVNDRCVDGLDNDDVRISYISFWALTSSIFCIGSDPRRIPTKYLTWFNHPGILEIHQTGIMPRPIGSSQSKKQVWWKRMPDGRVCVGLFNVHVFPFILGISCHVKVHLEDVGVVGRVQIKDVWTGQDMGIYSESYSVSLRPGQCQILMLTIL